jgi:hypothetical protein
VASFEGGAHDVHVANALEGAVQTRVAINPNAQVVRRNPNSQVVQQGGPYGKKAPIRGGKEVARRDQKWAPDRSGSE